MRFLKIIGAGLLIFSLLNLLKILLAPTYLDFNFYYSALQTLVSGNNPYALSYFPFPYPPFALFILGPLAYLPLPIAAKLFVILSFVCIFASFGLLLRLFKIKLLSWMTVILTIALCNLFPVKFSLIMGQINPLILLLVVLFLYGYQKNRSILAGISLALAVNLKLFPFLLLPYLIILKKWRILLYFLLTSICIGVLLVIFIPANSLSLFIHHTVPILFKVGGGMGYLDQSFSASLVRLTDNPQATNLAKIISLLLIGTTYLILWLKRNDKNSHYLGFSSLIILNVILNNFAWQHHYIWLIIPFLVAFSVINTKKPNAYFYITITLSYLLIAFNLKNPVSVPLIIQSHVLYGGFILYGLTVYFLLRNKPSK